MYLEQLLNIYVNELDTQYRLYSMEELKHSSSFKQVYSEFNSIVKYAMSLDKNGKFAEKIFADIEEYNKTAKQKINLADNKRAEFLDPNGSKTANYRSFYKNALLNDKNLIENFDANFAKSGLKLNFLKNYELNQNYQKKLVKERALDDRSKQLLGNYDTDFLKNGAEIPHFQEGTNERENINNIMLSMNEAGKKYERDNRIANLMAYSVEREIGYNDDFTGRAKSAYNLIFNIDNNNPQGDELTAENMELGLTAIGNLIANHNQRPLWQRFFGFFGKIGNELREANEMKNRMIARYNLNPELVDTIINNDGVARENAIEQLRNEKGLTMYFDVDYIKNPNDDREGYNIEEKGKEKKLSFNDDIIFDKEDIINGLDIDDDKIEDVFENPENKDEYGYDFDKIDDDFNLEDEEQRRREKLIVTFDKKKATPEMFEKFKDDDIDIGLYTRGERRNYINEIENIDAPQNFDGLGEQDINLEFSNKMRVLEHQGKISEIIDDSEMLHKILEQNTNEVVDELTEPIKMDNNIKIDDPKIDK